MFRKCAVRFPSGVISRWAEQKSFGFATVDNTEDTVLVHRDAIVKPREGRAPSSLRRGTRIEFDIIEENGKKKTINIAGEKGATLTTKDEVRASHVNLSMLHGSFRDAKNADDRHGLAISGILTSITQISKDFRTIERMNRNISKLLVAIADKEGVKDILHGEDYNAAKVSVMKNVLADQEERRRKGSLTEEEDVDENDAPEANENVASDSFHTTDSLLSMMESPEPTKKSTKKSKKSKDE